MPTAASSFRLTILVLILLATFGSTGGAAHGQQKPGPSPTFEELLKKIASARADACSYPGEDFSDLEFRLFEQADKAVVQALNEQSNTSSGAAIGGSAPSGSNPAGGGPRGRATEALDKLERLSADVNRSWPGEKRFHTQVLEVSPGLLVKMTYRNRATFTFFAIPQRDPYNKPTNLWQAIYAVEDHRFKPAGGYDWLDLFPLERGPARRARFLARFGYAGCGSGVGVAYYAYEWSPQDTGDLNEFIKLEGAVSREDPAGKGKPPNRDRLYSFTPVGDFRTQGSTITLPYCWYSAIDTWNNPSLCAVDSYDVSSDRARFVSSVFNRPDLLPVAKAIHYAQAHDYAAVGAYCGSSDVARQMIRDIPPFVFAEEGLDIKQIAPSKERVEIGGRQTLQFEVEKRADTWLVTSFRID